MQKFYKMSDTQMELMRVIWDSDSFVTISQLLTIFESRNWKVQTMATFLRRLVGKGILAVDDKKYTNKYYPAITEQKYYQLEAQNLLSSMYDGSLQNFLSALYGNGKANFSEVEELKKWFERAGKND